MKNRWPAVAVGLLVGLVLAAGCAQPGPRVSGSPTARPITTRVPVARGTPTAVVPAATSAPRCDPLDPDLDYLAHAPDPVAAAAHVGLPLRDGRVLVDILIRPGRGNVEGELSQRHDLILRDATDRPQGRWVEALARPAALCALARDPLVSFVGVAGGARPM